MANYSSNGPLRLQSNNAFNAGYMDGSHNEAYTILLGHAAGNAGLGETYVSARNANNFMVGWAAGIENGNYQPVLLTTTGINFNVNHNGDDNNGKWVDDITNDITHVTDLLNHYTFSSYYDLSNITFPLQIFLYADYNYTGEVSIGARVASDYSNNALDVKIQYQNTSDAWVDFSGSLTNYDSTNINLVDYINDASVTVGGYDIGGSDAPTDISNNNFRVVFKANGGNHPYPKVIIKSTLVVEKTSGNFFSGYFAGQSNTGNDNIAIGNHSLQFKASGNGNIALGVNAGIDRNVNTLTYNGRSDESHTQHPLGLTNCTMIGANTGFDVSSVVNVSYSNSVALGANARITDSNQIVLGATEGFGATPDVYIPGKLGIGITNPLMKLDVMGSIRLGTWKDTTRYIGFTNRDNDDTFISGIELESVEVESGDTYSQNIHFHTHTHGVNESHRRRMTVKYDGNVGIGTTSPDAPLHVSKYENSDNNIIEILKLERRCEDIFPLTQPGGDGTLAARNAEGGYIGLYVKDENNDGESSGVYYVNSELARISWRADNQYNYEGDGRLSFWTSRKASASKDTYGIHERMTITRDGYVGIGTTDPGYLLDVSGDIRAITTVYTSDDRLKHNETDISNALQHIRDLHPQHYIKTYEMYEADHMFPLDICGQPIDSSGNVVRHFIEEGLIAQDLLQIDAFKPFVSVPTDPITKPYSVNYNSIFVHSLKALQELDAEHTKTKTELEQTKQNLTETISNLESLLQSALSRITALETQSTS